MLRSLSGVASRISRMKQGVRFLQMPPWDGSPWRWPDDSSDGGAEESKGGAEDSSKVIRVLGVPGCPLAPPLPRWHDSVFPPFAPGLDHFLHEVRQCLEEAAGGSEEQLSELNFRLVGLRAYARQCLEEAAGGSEEQLFELKFRLVALRAYAPGITIEDIMNDPRLDLESLPMVSKHDISECIKSYVAVLHAVEASDSYSKCLLFLVSGDYNQLSTSPTKLLNILRMQNVFLEATGFNLASAVEDYLALCDMHNPSRSEDSKMRLLEMFERDSYCEMSRIYDDGLKRTLFST